MTIHYHDIGDGPPIVFLHTYGPGSTARGCLMAVRLADWWAGATVVSRGQVHRPAELIGFLAEDGGHPVGLLTLQVADGACEVVTLNSGRVAYQGPCEKIRHDESFLTQQLGVY